MEMKGLGLFARFPSTLLQTDNRPVSSSDSCLKTNNYAYVNYQPCEGAERLQPTASLVHSHTACHIHTHTLKPTNETLKDSMQGVRRDVGPGHGGRPGWRAG